MSPVQGYQPDTSFVFQHTNVAEQLRNLGLRSYLASHIPDLIASLRSTEKATTTPCQRIQGRCFLFWLPQMNKTIRQAAWPGAGNQHIPTRRIIQ